MKLQLIRNATIRLEYAGRSILVDPYLSPRGAMDPFVSDERNPTVELPMPVADVVRDLDAFIVTHEHPDHWDPAAAEAIAPDVPAFCQPGVEGRLGTDGFGDVTVVEADATWHGIVLTRTGGHHGRGEIEAAMGPVSGFVLSAPDEPTVYIVGDSIWCDEVDEAIAAHAPDVIVTNSGGATIPGHDPILMEITETLRVAEAAPEALVVAIHLESLDHCPVTRAAMQDAATEAGLGPDRLRVPADGETIEVSAG